MLEVNYESSTPQVSNANILEKHYVVPQNIFAPLSTTETSTQYIIKKFTSISSPEQKWLKP